MVGGDDTEVVFGGEVRGAGWKKKKKQAEWRGEAESWSELDRRSYSLPSHNQLA